MAVKPGKIVAVMVMRGMLTPQRKRFIRNRKGLRLKGIVRRGNP